MSIFKLLHQYQNLFSQNNHIKTTDTEILINNNEVDYLKISDLEINLFGIDILSKLKNNRGNDWNNFDAYNSFIKRTNNHIIKLNHFGFGYRVYNLETELTDIKDHLTDDFQLVEEESDDVKNNRWFFLVHKANRSVPKIELVLYLTDKYQDFCPQFQIDIDTNLSYESLKNITDESLGKDFFFWKYDIPKYGVVMAMGKIGQIDGINILVGIGTNLRKQQSFKF